ncbi:MAG: YceI family protein [Candidatus Promineifilaceae bacterium]
MSRKNITIGGIAVVLVGIVAVAALAYAFLRPTEEASGPIEAVPLSANTPDPADTDDDDEHQADTDGEGTFVDDDDSDGAEPSDAIESEPGGSEPVLFEIVQAESEARFIIDEVLRGNPKNVIGLTDQIAGEILFDAADPASAQVGTILVNARTLSTDDNRRNRAIGNQILDSDNFEFISFTPTAVTGLPASAGAGESVTFQITGDLAIRDVTNEVTFQVTVVPVSADRLEGRASTTIQRGDYGLIIPSVPFVANVGEEVLLELDFVALPVGG